MYALVIRDTGPIIHRKIKRIRRRLRNHRTGLIIKTKRQTRARPVRIMLFVITRTGLACIKSHKLRGRPRNFFE